MKPVDDPLALFATWLKEAEVKEPNDPNAVAVATATKDGLPSVRMCLLKGADERGFVFYTNLGSRKAHELDDNPRAALLFHWKSLKRQVRVEGAVERVSDEEADSYFASRARISQIGAWASKQSRPLTGRGELEARVAKMTARFGVGAVPRPEFWSGYRVVPSTIELWEDRPFRLHMRWLYHKTADGWHVTELFP